MPTRLWVSYNCQAVYDIPEGIDLDDTSQVKSYESKNDVLTITLVDETSLEIESRKGIIYNLDEPTHYSEEEIDSDDEDDDDDDDEDQLMMRMLEGNMMCIRQNYLKYLFKEKDEYKDMVASKDKQIQDLLKKNAEQYKHIMELLQTIHGSQ